MLPLDMFLRLPPAAAALVFASILQISNGHVLPRQTATVELRELNVLPWPPIATPAPRSPNDLRGLRLRQLNTVCGYIAGNPDLPATCSAGSHCAADVEHGAIGCCPDSGPCTQGVFTGCVDSNSGPQTEINPYVFTCGSGDVCYRNEYDGGFFQFGCGSASDLATLVASTAPGQPALVVTSLSVDLTAEPSTLSEPTIIGSGTSDESSATSEATSDASSSKETASRTASTDASSTQTTASTDTNSAETTGTSSSTSETTQTNTAATSATSEPSIPAAPIDDSDDRTQNTGAIIGGTIGGVAGAVLLIAAAAFLWRRRRGNLREGPGPTQGTEFIKSPIDGGGHSFAPLPPAQESPQSAVPRGPPMAYSRPSEASIPYGGNPYENPYANSYQGQETNFSSVHPGEYWEPEGAVGAFNPSSPSTRSLEQDEIPLTRESQDYNPHFDAAGLHAIREEDATSNNSTQESEGSGMHAYPPRGGGRPLWQQNRNPMWM